MRRCVHGISYESGACADCMGAGTPKPLNLNPTENQTGLTMKYFVLKPEGDNPYAAASRAAITAYAVHIMETNPNLARDLFTWVNSLEPANQKPDAEG